MLTAMRCEGILSLFYDSLGLLSMIAGLVGVLGPIGLGLVLYCAGGGRDRENNACLVAAG